MKTNYKIISTRFAALSIGLFLLLTLSGRSVVAQSPEVTKPTTEVDQLKDRLQQLEQTVKDLKGQISAIEESQKNPAPKIVEATYSSAAPTASVDTKSAPAKSQDDKKGESTFTIYGFAMLDAGYQFKQTIQIGLTSSGL
jgi:hypothetical protein